LQNIALEIVKTDAVEVYITIPQILAKLPRCSRMLLGPDELSVLPPQNNMDL
jgi:hypothetical protein